MPHAKLGQHWLVDKRECEKIAQSVSLSENEICIEIGGGKGALTRHLAGKCRRLIVYEIDPKWADHLEEHSPKWGSGVEVRRMDALKINWNRDDLGISANEPVVIAGNIPYYITSPLFLQLVYSYMDFQRAVFLIQKDVAKRICASPGDSEYSRLTVSLGAFVRTEIVHDVPPEAFLPKPKVVSSVIRMVRHAEPKVPPEMAKLFEKTVQISFHMRRKTLKNNLREAYKNLPMTKIEELIEELEIKPDARPQEIPVEKYVSLTHRLADELK